VTGGVSKCAACELKAIPGLRLYSVEGTPQLIKSQQKKTKEKTMEERTVTKATGMLTFTMLVTMM
jgi:hypothetical protein